MHVEQTIGVHAAMPFFVQTLLRNSSIPYILMPKLPPTFLLYLSTHATMGMLTFQADVQHLPHVFHAGRPSGRDAAVPLPRPVHPRGKQ